MNKQFIKNDYDKIKSIIADDAKTAAILDDMLDTVKQLRAKTTFRLSLANQIKEAMEDKGLDHSK